MATYDNEQKRQILLGIQKGLDVSKYDNPKYSARLMELIRKGLEEGYDLSYYAKSGFSFDQILEIYKGMQTGVDVGKYADKRLNSRVMEAIRTALLKGQNIEKYIPAVIRDYKYQEEKLSLVLHCLEQGIEPPPEYVSPDYNYDQSKELIYGLLDGLDVSKYANPRYDADFMRDIRLTMLTQKFFDTLRASGVPEHVIEEYMEHFTNPYIRDSIIRQILKIAQMGYDVQKFVRKDFSKFEIDVVVDALEHGIDLSKYIDMGFEESDLELVSIGLKLGLDVDKYAKPEYDSITMWAIFEGLAHGIDLTSIDLGASIEEIQDADKYGNPLDHLIYSVILYDIPVEQLNGIFKDVINMPDEMFSSQYGKSNAMEIIIDALACGIDYREHIDFIKKEGTVEKAVKSLIKNKFMQEFGLNEQDMQNYSYTHRVELLAGKRLGFPMEHFLDRAQRLDSSLDFIIKAFKSGVDVTKIQLPHSDVGEAVILVSAELGLALPEPIDENDDNSYLLAFRKAAQNKINEITGTTNMINVYRYSDLYELNMIEQIKQVILGLQDGVDVKQYEDLKIEYDELLVDYRLMEAVRLILKSIKEKQEAIMLTIESEKKQMPNSISR